MNHQNQLKYIFDECEECGKELNDMEKEYCKKMTEKKQIITILYVCMSRKRIWGEMADSFERLALY